MSDWNTGKALGQLLARLDGRNAAALEASAERLCASLAEGHTCVPADEAIRSITNSRAITTGEENAPLVLDNDRLYLRRYWLHETELAQLLQAKANAKPAPMPICSAILDTLTNEQKAAAEQLFTNGLAIVTGGPGTGKSTFAASVVQAAEGMQIQLAAPTGRAASRLAESGLAQTPTTLHRLLGYQPSTGRYRYGAEHQLSCDLLIVDECSMIDLALFKHLMAAIDPVRTRILLLGDADQLASVEAGSVFGEIVQAGRLQDFVFRLTQNFRFGAESQIGQLASALRCGDSKAALDIANAGLLTQIQATPQELAAEFSGLLNAQTPEAALERLADFRVLCARRIDTEKINEQLSDFRIGAQHLPLLITQNDYHLELFNGDSGVLWQRNEPIFAGTPLRRINRARLQHWSHAWAMTVHRAQGSEFEQVLLVLPSEDHPLLTRELLYTAVTRARTQLRIVGSPEVLTKAIERRSTRHSGLLDKLSR